MELYNDKSICFAKVRPDAIIPTKEKEDMGYDIYANFGDNEVYIYPGEVKLIPTGIASACSDKYGFLLEERGSTGTKGMAKRCGVIDSGYRKEWFVPINNTSTKTILITKEVNQKPIYNTTIYPYTKAICQAIMVEVPVMNVQEVSYSDLVTIPSKRGMGNLGSSNK